MADSRAYALFPRPFLIPACASCGGAPLVDLIGPQDLVTPGLVLFPEYPLEGKLPEGCRGTTIAGPETFPYAIRTPGLKVQAYEAVALLVHCQ